MYPAAVLPALPALLEPVATNARRMMARTVRTTYASLGAAVDRTDYAEYSLTAAFMAYIDLDGDPDHPERFAWDANRKELYRRAARHLARRVRAEVEHDNDEVKRHRPRKEGAVVEQYRWDAWRDNELRQTTSGVERGDKAADSSHRRDTTNGLGDDVAPQERALAEQDLQQLAHALAEVLSDEELELITRVYFQGVPQVVVAAELAAARGAPLKRCETVVNVRMHRARSRLKHRLDPRWQQLLGGQ